jgi:2,5-dihydroxypyridine 5,6-dioxygenase
MFELMNGLRSIIENCMQVKSGENALVITEDDGGSVWLGELFLNVLNSIGAVPIHAIVVPADIAHTELPAAVAAAMKNVNVFLAIEDKIEIGHTTAQKEARNSGVRCYMLNRNIPLDDLKRGVSLKDLEIIKNRSENLKALLSRSSTARVTSPSGTDITMCVAGRASLAAYPNSQETGVLPDYAESAITPVEGTAEGTIVADVCVLQLGFVLRQPLKYIVKAGRVVDVSGSKEDVEKIRGMLNADENANNITELGIGTSHIIPPVIRGTRRDGGRLGTVHIGMGRNNDIGGKTYSHIHFDSLMSQAAVELDGKRILQNGVLTLKS